MNYSQEKLSFIKKIHQISNAGLNINNKIGDVIYDLVYEKFSEVEKKVLEINSGRTLKDLQNGIAQLADQVVNLSMKVEEIEKKLEDMTTSKEPLPKSNRGRKPFKLKEKE